MSLHISTSLLLATMDLALEQGEVEKRIQAVQDEVKKQDDAIKELQKKFKVREATTFRSPFTHNIPYR